MAHSPKPFVKSFLFEIEEIAKDLFYKIRSKNFRTWNTPGIIGDFVPRWLEYRRIAEIIQIDELYIESGDYKIETKLNLLSKKFGKVPFFCINDTCDDADLFDKRLVLIKKVMQKLLPNKSRFEK